MSPVVGQHIKVTVKKLQIRQAANWPLPNVEEVVYEGQVIASPQWLSSNQFAMTTGIRDFPVRVIDNKDVIRINGVQVILDNSVEVPKTVSVVGSKGDTYVVTVVKGRAISCTCPAFAFRRASSCKHFAIAEGNGGQVNISKPVVKKVKQQKQSKKEICQALINQFGKTLTRKQYIEKFIASADMTPASASTYYATLRPR